MKTLSLLMLSVFLVTLTVGPASAAPLLLVNEGSMAPVPQSGIVFHDSVSAEQVFTTEGRINIGHYREDTTPWMDLLVYMNGQWYGPNRPPNDGIQAQPLPAGYRWVVTDPTFGAKTNGEVWWNGGQNSAQAILYNPAGHEVLRFRFRVNVADPDEDTDKVDQNGDPLPELEK